MAQADPPGRVARLSYIYGGVSFRPAGVDDWAPIEPQPAAHHWRSRYSVEFAGSAELQIGSAALRMKSATALEFLNLDDSNVQLRLTEGSLIVRLRYLGDQDSFEVDTPNLAFSLLRTGEYRIDVKPDSSTTLVTVRARRGRDPRPQSSFHRTRGRTGAGGRRRSAEVIKPSVPRRSMRWTPGSEGRDQRDDQSPSARYVSREMVGYQDRDRYGSWRNTPELWKRVGAERDAGWMGALSQWPLALGGPVGLDLGGRRSLGIRTVPTMAGVGVMSAIIGVGCRGEWLERPVYAPALVAWVGGGAIGGGVAWFALGPREVYVPSYHASPVYMNLA